MGKCSLSQRAAEKSFESLIDHQRTHRILLKFFAAVEEAEFYEEGNLQNLRAELLDQCCRGCCGAAGGQQIVDQKNSIAGFEGIDVDCNSGGAVLEIVLFLVSLVWEFAFFSDGDEPSFESHGCRSSENK